MHVLLVHNQNSGSATEIDPEALLVDHGCTVVSAGISEAAGWSRAASGDEHLRGVERVVVAGGDGSLGCAARIAYRLDVPLGVLPAGTANDFARAMDLPTDIAQAGALAATGSRTRDVDLGDVDGRPFVNVAAIGLAPDATRHAERLKKELRSLAYPVGALLAAVRRRPVSIIATVDGVKVWSGRAWQVILANSGAFGGWADTGLTRDGDGQLDLVIVPAVRGSRELAADAASLKRGDLAERDGVHHFRGARIDVVLRRSPHIVVDGELVELDTHHVVATAAQRPLRVIVG